MSEPSPARPAVVVIGGGYAGINVARSLDDVASVVLVEPKDAFVHNVAALRALVNPSWLPRIYLPYGGLLSHGRIAADRAVKVNAGRVVLASGEELPADYIVQCGAPSGRGGGPGQGPGHDGGPLRGDARGTRRGPGRGRVAAAVSTGCRCSVGRWAR